MSALLKKAQEHWQALGPLLTIRGERDYADAVELLGLLLAEVGTDEQHPLYGFLDTLGTLIHAYEEEHVPIPEASGPEVLEYLMEEHNLRPEDLPELGGAKRCALSWRRRERCTSVRFARWPSAFGSRRRSLSELRCQSSAGQEAASRRLFVPGIQLAPIRRLRLQSPLFKNIP